MRKTVIRVVKGIILLVAIVTLANMTYKHIRTYYDDYMDEYKGTESTQGEDVTVTIPEGASVKEIAQILKDNGSIIRVHLQSVCRTLSTVASCMVVHTP